MQPSVADARARLALLPRVLAACSFLPELLTLPTAIVTCQQAGCNINSN